MMCAGADYRDMMQACKIMHTWDLTQACLHRCRIRTSHMCLRAASSSYVVTKSASMFCERAATDTKRNVIICKPKVMDKSVEMR